MIPLLIADIDGKELTLDSIIQMIDENTEEVYGGTSPVKLSMTEDGTFEIKAFETKTQYTRIYSGSYAPLFKIIE